MNSKQKGNRGENEIVQFLRQYGVDGVRSDQRYVGGVGRPDVFAWIAGKGYHIEVKRTETIRMNDWLAQVIYDSAPTPERTPAIVFRKNRGKWWIVQPLESFLQGMGLKDSSSDDSGNGSERGF